MNEYKKAESFYLESIQIRQNVLGKEHPDLAGNYFDLANLYWNTKQPQKAKDLYSEAFQLQTMQLKKIFQFTSEMEKQSYLKIMSEDNNGYLSFNTANFSNSNNGFTYSVSLSNRQLILASSQQLRNTIYNTGDTNIQNKYGNWINLREQLSFWYAKPVAERPDYVKDLEEQANTLEKELTRRSSTFKKSKSKMMLHGKTFNNILNPMKLPLNL